MVNNSKFLGLNAICIDFGNSLISEADWIKCISIGIIVAVISKIIIFPEGILENTSQISRFLATICLIITYYFLGKNILLSVSLGTALFTILNYYNI